MKYARDKGVVIVAAAGNDGRGRVGYPAGYPGVVAVAATQFDETTTFYSNWGKESTSRRRAGTPASTRTATASPTASCNTPSSPATSQTDYLWFMGTSMASPHAAGVAALIMGAGVRKPDAVEEILLGTARKPKAQRSRRAGAWTTTTARASSTRARRCKKARRRPRRRRAWPGGARSRCWASC